MNITKYIEHLPFIMFFKILCDDRITLDVFGYKIDIFHITCAIALFSLVISYISCFYAKIFIKCNFSTDYSDGSLTILIEWLKFRTNSLQKRSCKSWLKITLPKNKSKQKFQSDIEACASTKTDRRENVKFIVTNFKDRFTSYITTTYPNMFSIGLSVISKVFVANLSMCLFAGKDIAQKLSWF